MQSKANGEGGGARSMLGRAAGRLPRPGCLSHVKHVFDPFAIAHYWGWVQYAAGKGLAPKREQRRVLCPAILMRVHRGVAYGSPGNGMGGSCSGHVREGVHVGALAASLQACVGSIGC